MSNDLAPATTRTGGLPALTFDSEQVAVIRNQICKPKNRDATDGELGLFLARCLRTGLDPIAGQIVAVFRKDNQNNGVEKMSMQVTVEGQRAIANATGEYIGSDREWCGTDGQWVDVWLDQEQQPAAARVTVRRLRGNTVIEQKAVVAWHEAGGHTDKYPSPFWKSQPAHMLAKTAEARALKIAFPGEIGGAQDAVAIDTPAAPVGDAPAELPAWAAEPTAEQWKAAGLTWKELADKLDVGLEATQDSWRTMVRAFGNRKTLGLATALADGLAELLINVPVVPDAQPVEGSATEETA